VATVINLICQSKLSEELSNYRRWLGQASSSLHKARGRCLSWWH